MATAEAVAQFQSALRGLSALAQAELRSMWAGLDPSDAAGTSAVLQDFMPALIAEYGDMGAAVAADYYEELRADAGARGRFRALLADPVPDDALRINTRYNLQPLWGKSDPDQALSNLELVTDKQVKASGRNTIELNIQRDPTEVRFARVPTGAKTCKFCLMLASRGAIYLSEKTADDGYHGDCDCQPTPIWDENDLPEGYDPDALYDEYKRLEREPKN